MIARIRNWGIFLLVATSPALAKIDPNVHFDEIDDQIMFMLWGFLLVVGILSLLWGVCNVNYAIARWVEGIGKKAPVAAVPVAPVAPQVQATDSRRLIAVLTAAAHEALGVPVRIVQFKNVQGNSCSWVAHGRAAHHSSHKPQQ